MHKGVSSRFQVGVPAPMQHDWESADLGAAFNIGQKNPWFVLHTKSRQEKALADELRILGIAHFLPSVERIRFYGKRKAVVEEPLFSGYLFLRGSLEDAYRADRTRRLASVIPVADQAQIDWELRNLAVVLAQKVTLDPYPSLRVGRRVQVRSGPLQGIQGLVEDRLTWNRLILGVRMLGQAVSLELDGSLLEVLD